MFFQLFPHIHRCTLRESDAISLVEGTQVHLFIIADAQPYGHDSSQQFPMLARIETGQRQLVPTFLLAQVAYLPDKVVGRFVAEPRLQRVADTIPLILSSEEAPRALQHPPELHETYLIILYFYHSGSKFFTLHLDAKRRLYSSVFTYLPVTSS